MWDFLISKKCTCGSQDIDYHESSGHAVCCSCGRIIEENTIVSSLEFEETGDRSHVIGQYISADGSKASRSNGRFRNRSNNQESRSITLSNARRAIQQVASILRLPLLFVEKAHKLYGMALKQRFMFGRQQSHVVATCLYTVCRLEKSPHLLIDFSDALQVNVYVLGKTFVEFGRLLNLQEQMIAIDPALYIHRFASRLNIGDKVNSIITMSLRIITRMKKDWIATGRRPDGICASAMLISMRCHDIHKNQLEICKIFRVSEGTLKRRMNDFKATPAAQMSLQEFSTTVPTDIETMQSFDDGFDPPSYIKNIYEEQRAIDLENSVEEGDDECFNVEPKSFVVKARKEMYENILAEVMSDQEDESETFVRTSKLAGEDADLSSKKQNTVDDSELEDYILSPEEQTKRSVIFDRNFKAFLEDRAQRKCLSVKESKGKRSLSYIKESSLPPIEAGESDRKSKKINYDVLSDNKIGTQIHKRIESLESVSIKRKTIKAGSISNAVSNIIKSTEVSESANSNENPKILAEYEDDDDDLLYEENDNGAEDYGYDEY